MRLAATKPAAILITKRQSIPAPRARVATATAAGPCSEAAKKSRSDGASWRIAVASSDAEADGEFLRHPDGVASLLNTGALESFAPAGAGPGTFTCTLRRIRFLGFEVAPVLELRVTPTSTDCTVEMLSCRFEGSESVERQNELFSAFMSNRITWSDDGEEPCLDIDVTLEVTLEVYTKPFSMLPLSAVEKPGNLLMQGLLDRLVPVLGEQLLRDYHSWVQQQPEASS